MDDFLSEFVTTVISNATIRRETELANHADLVKQINSQHEEHVRGYKAALQAQIDYPAAAEKADADFAAAVKAAATDGDYATASKVASESRDYANSLKSDKAPSEPADPVIPPPPKSAESFAPMVRANPLVARAYPNIAGFDVQRDDKETEMAISVVDEDGTVLARYSGIRG